MNRCPIAEVAAICAEAATEAFDFLGDVAAVLQRSADADDIGSRGSKSDRRRTADSTSTAGDERCPAAEVELRRASCPAIDEDLHRLPPCPKLSEDGRHRSSGSTAVINGSKSIEPLGQQLDCRLEVFRLIHPRTEDLEFLPEQVEECDRVGSGKIATTTIRPRRQACCVDARIPAADPDTSNTMSAPTSVGRVCNGSLDVVGKRVQSSEAVVGRQAAADSIRLDDQHTSTAVGSDQGDQDADRAAADDNDGLAGRNVSSANVVAGDRQRLGKGGDPKIEVGGQFVQRESRNSPGRLQGSRSVDSEEPQAAADVAESSILGRLTTCVERAHDDAITDAESRQRLRRSRRPSRPSRDR